MKYSGVANKSAGNRAIFSGCDLLSAICSPILDETLAEWNLELVGALERRGPSGVCS